MKRRLLLVGLMCLVTVCTWAKDMTVLITDSKDLPIPGLQAFISGTVPTEQESTLQTQTASL